MIMFSNASIRLENSVMVKNVVLDAIHIGNIVWSTWVAVEVKGSLSTTSTTGLDSSERACCTVAGDGLCTPSFSLITPTTSTRVKMTSGTAAGRSCSDVQTSVPTGASPALPTLLVTESGV